MKHVMIDIETLGTSKDAAIVSIGAAFFDLNTGEVGERFYVPIDLELSEYGEIDASTVKWWMRQSEEARAVFADKNAVTIKRALHDLSSFIRRCKKSNGGVKIWGNGCTFDNVILETSYKALGIDKPWGNYADRDVRTVVEMGREILGIDPKREMVFEGDQHNALDDVLHQIKYVCTIVNAFSALKPNNEKAVIE